VSSPDTATPAKRILRIVSLDPARPELAGVIAGLHMRLLPTSPAVLLGEPFLRDFYYSLLPTHGLIRAAVAYVDDVPAAFVAVTSDPDGFMGKALRRWWYRLAWTLIASVVARPFTRIPALWEAAQIMTSRRGGAQEASTGEIMSLGVLAEYTDPKFVAASGLRIARELIDHGIRELIAAGTKKVVAVVDADNLPARFMYFGMGWKLSRSTVPGWRTPSVEFMCEVEKWQEKTDGSPRGT